MKAKELRIGNYITRKSSTDTTCTVNWGIIKEFELGERNEYMPIPLTDKWLKKFRFKFDKTEGGWFLELTRNFHTETCLCVDIHTGINKNLLSLVFKDRKTKKLHHHNYQIDCEYVHQLQNLYFSLSEQDFVLAVTPKRKN